MTERTIDTASEGSVEVITSTRKRPASDETNLTADPINTSLPQSHAVHDASVSAEGASPDDLDEKRQKLLEEHSAEDIDLALKFLAQAKK